MSQYKNRKNFANLCCHEQDFEMSAEWHFFATSHGKGPCDGVGGTVKRLAARASLQRLYEDQILTPRQLFDLAVLQYQEWTFTLHLLKTTNANQPFLKKIWINNLEQLLQIRIAFTVFVRYPLSSLRSEIFQQTKKSASNVCLWAAAPRLITLWITWLTLEV